MTFPFQCAFSWAIVSVVLMLICMTLHSACDRRAPACEPLFAGVVISMTSLFLAAGTLMLLKLWSY